MADGESVHRPQEGLGKYAAERPVTEMQFFATGGRMNRTAMMSLVSLAAEMGVFFAAAGALAAGVLQLR